MLSFNISVTHTPAGRRCQGSALLLKSGEVFPCDSIFLSGRDVRYEESDTTGEQVAVVRTVGAHIFLESVGSY
jgi:high-affinity K+ transport system ATPase subunit B